MREFAPSRRLIGGLRLPANKSCSTARPIQHGPIPERLIVSTCQHRGAPADPAVEPGQRVLAGDTLAKATTHNGADVHAPASGQIVSIESRDVPLGSGVSTEACIVIAPDAQDTPQPRAAAIEIAAGTAERAEQLRAAGIVGLGGATYPTAAKLARSASRPCQLLIINGAECEPYISCDDMLMREAANEVVDGAILLRELTGAGQCVIAIERDKPQAIEAVGAAAEARGDEDIAIAELPSVYPAGGERQLVEMLAGVEIGSGRFPGDFGFLCQNVGTARAVHRYFRHGQPLTRRVVTITGGAVANPGNVEAMIGTPIAELIAACGGYSSSPAALIHGGSMMGYSLASDQLPVTKATNCIIVADQSEIRSDYREWPCIRCGECASVCPARLKPEELLPAARGGNMPALKELALADCIECGCCDVVCPSHIPLTGVFRAARPGLRRYLEQQNFAEISDRRFQLHEQRRLATETDEQQQRQVLKASLSAEEQRAALIREAVERARKRKADSDAD